MPLTNREIGRILKVHARNLRALHEDLDAICKILLAQQEMIDSILDKISEEMRVREMYKALLETTNN